jgi:hypothetical protein
MKRSGRIWQKKKKKKKFWRVSEESPWDKTYEEMERAV